MAQAEYSSSVGGEDDADDFFEDIDNCSESTEAGDKVETKSNDSEHEETDDGKKDVDGKENISDSASQDGQTKKSPKGMGKKLKRFMGAAMRPLASKYKWKLGFNFEASNEASERNDGRRKGGKKTSQTPNDEDQKISSIDAAKMRRLLMENKRLQKQAEKHRDEHSKLETRISELSEVEHQLITTRSNYVKLKEELLESQSCRENLIAKMSKQSEEQRIEVNRLDAELKKAAKDVAKLEEDKQSIEDKDRKNVESLLIMKTDLETLMTIRDKLNLGLSKQEENYLSETSRLIENLKIVEKEKNEQAVEHQEKIMEFQRDTVNLEERAKKAEMENVRQKQEIKQLEAEAAGLIESLDASTAKVEELQGVINGIIESNSSISPTVEPANGGIFPCPMCGKKFASLSNRHLHAQGCRRYTINREYY